MNSMNVMNVMNSGLHWLLLACAGAVGTLLRAGCNHLSVRYLGSGFPWATLGVNVLGSFAFGAIIGLSRSRDAMPIAVEKILLVGLLGGFTTFSSFAFQSFEMLENGRPLTGIAYILGTNSATLLAIWGGLRLFGG